MTGNPLPLAVLAASFAAGILLTHLTAAPTTIYLVTVAVCSMFAVVGLALGKHGIATLVLVVAFGGTGASLAVFERQDVAADRVRRFYDDEVVASGEPVELTGVVERAPEVAPDGFYVVLRVERWRSRGVERAASGRVQFFAPVRERSTWAEYAALELRRGARVRVMSAPTRADNFRNPGVSGYTEYLEQRGFDAAGTIKSPLLVERLDDERVFLPLVWLDAWRARLVSNIGGLFSTETAGVLNATLLGNRYGLTQPVAERFREGGTFHVLVISGLHITFVGGLALALFGRVTKRRAGRFAAAVGATWIYALAVGAESSVLRAALMFSMVALAPVLHRRSNALNALGGAALLLLVVHPADLFDASWQLTFLSVLIIFALAWPLVTKLREAGAWQPSRATPYPPVCPRWFLWLGETLFWSERHWSREMSRETYSYRLFKTPLAARLERWRVQWLARYVFGAFVVSTCVQLGLLPLLVLYFHRLSLAALVLNIVVGALMVALACAALASLAASQLSAGVAAPFVWVAEQTNRLMVHSVDPFVGAGIASWRLPEYTGWPASVYVLYYVVLVVLAIALARWRPVGPVPSAAETDEKPRGLVRLATRFAAVGLVALFVVIVAHPSSARRLDKRLRVDFLDVGQGDAALLTMPDGVTLLVDGGGRTSPGMRPREDAGDGRADDGAAATTTTAGASFARDSRSVGEAVVSEYLWWRGLDRIDYVLATHADADHLQGLNDVARNFKVRAALVARTPAREPEYKRFAATAATADVTVHLIGRGDRLRFGEVSIDVLWPPRVAEDVSDAATSSRGANDESLVLRVRFGARVFLLTGDIEARAEDALIAARDDLRCDALKVAHHGSRTSSTENFVGATRAAHAVISVGQNSQYGHPHAAVVERWQRSGAEVLTTGTRGSITLSTDGRDIKVETFVRDEK